MKIACSLFLSSLLLLQATAQDLPNAPDNIDDLCTGVDFCSQEALVACALECEPAACCASEGADNCFDTDTIACSSYVPCLSLEGWGDLACASEDVAMCAEDLAVDANLAACISACEPAACCTSEGADNCFLADVNACLTYAPCENLFVDDGAGALAVATADVDEFCTQDLSVDANFAGCAAACVPATCCSAAGDDSCVGTDLAACLTYLPCQNLLPFDDGGDASTAPSAAPLPTDVSVPVATIDVAEFCTQDLSVDATFVACAAACVPATCCAAAGDDSCLGTDLAACLTYLPCQNLLPFVDDGGDASTAPSAAPAPTDVSFAPSTFDDSGAAFAGFGFAALVAVSLFFVNV